MYVLWIIVCPFVLFLLAIALSVVHGFWILISYLQTFISSIKVLKIIFQNVEAGDVIDCYQHVLSPFLFVVLLSFILVNTFITDAVSGGALLCFIKGIAQVIEPIKARNMCKYITN